MPPVKLHVPESLPELCGGRKPLISLLRRLRRENGVKHVFINSGIRLDLAWMQPELTAEIIRHHVSGHMKVAPEHLHKRVLALMRKGQPGELEEFMKIFDRISRECGKEQYLIPLFISNFPGCTEAEMKVVDDFLASHNWSLEQAQDYIPLPLTMGAAMYYTGKTPDGEPIVVNRGLRERRTQLDDAQASSRRIPELRGGKKERRRQKISRRRQLSWKEASAEKALNRLSCLNDWKEC